MLMVMNFFRRSVLASATGCRRCSPARAQALPTVCCTPFLSLAYPLGCLFCTRFVHRFENKWQIVLSALMTVVFGTLFALQNNPVMLVVCGFMITWSNAWLTISYHAYRRKSSDPDSRQSRGLCYSFSRLSTALTSILIGLILQYAGTRGN